MPRTLQEVDMRGTRAILFGLAAVIAAWVLLSRVRIVFLVHANFWQLALLFLILTVGLFLVLDWLFHRRRR
jgi:hypothetical protein